MLPLLRPALLLLGLVLSTGARAGGGLDQLHAFLDGLETLAARFEQSVLNPEQGTTGSFSGQLLLKRPDRFHWIYTAPYEQDIIADGRWVWVVDKDLEQVTQQSQEKALRGTPALVLLGDGELDSEFEVVELGEHQDMQWLELIPRDPEGPFERIQLALADDMLQRLETRDRFGHISRFVFQGMQRNLPLDDQLFKYQPTGDMDLFTP
jgi:outer membrane lipoprotein carrier protein